MSSIGSHTPGDVARRRPGLDEARIGRPLTPQRLVTLAGLMAFVLVTAATNVRALPVGWEHRDPEPPGNLNFAMAYDSARGRTVLFGGVASPADTWEWDGRVWTNVTSSARPSGRLGHAMAYDSARNRIVLFGGFPAGTSASEALADTWEWDGTTWMEVTPALSPPPRALHGMVYDAARDRVVLFGGRAPDGTALADTWEWDGRTWTDVTQAAGPPARLWAAMVNDSGRGRVVLFGGYGADGRLADTWEWNGTTWTNVTPAVGPGARGPCAMAFDSRRGRIVLFGGQDSTPPYSFLLDTWEWDGTTWSELTPAASPPGRILLGMAYDSARGRVVLFGGTTGDLLADTWEYDGTTWEDVTPRPSPSSRFHHAMAYDSARKRVVLFGGVGRAAGDDTWEWDGTAWTDVSPALSPPTGSDHAMAYDSSRERVVLYSGYDAYDTWEWDGSTWANVTPGAPGPSLTLPSMAYDSRRGRTVLFGRGSGSETWEWDGTTWIDVTPAVSPPYRIWQAMAYDGARGRVVLFGGYGAGGVLADTWEWDGTSWYDVTPAVSPPGRIGSALVYDESLGRVILFGGSEYSSTGTSRSDTWTWDGATWEEVTPPSGPSGRYFHAMAYDSARGRVVLFGGLSGRGTETWEYGELIERRCDGLDDNGDGQVDEGCDNDGDGYCDAAMPLGGLPEICPSGGGDCDDSDAAIHPSASELPGNTVDENCDGEIACDPRADYPTRGDLASCVARECRASVAAGHLTRAECVRMMAESE